MRRIRIALITVLILICPQLFAAVDPHKYEMDNVSQMVVGFVDVDTQLYLELDETYYDADDGINLDINDSSNKDKFLIAPSASHELGLRIGHFTFIAEEGTSGVITISHTHLKNTNNDTLDYELGISYSISGQTNPVQAYCTSSVNSGADGKKIDINLSDWVNTIYIKDGGIFFRLVTPPVNSGDYTSTITFVFTADTSGQGGQS